MRDKTEEYWKEKLTKEQFQVCRLKETEAPFSGDLQDNYKEGTYYCVACGVPLFASENKFESGSGWPSFFAALRNNDPMKKDNIELITDNSHAMKRTEVICRNCGSHLGHLFEDGPPPTGLRYCINSVALNFKASK